MSLTMGHGPLSAEPPETVNYRVEGPAHRLFAQPFPRRVRATFADRTVLDTHEGLLLHETGLLPQLYVPDADVDGELLVASDHHTTCPFKGEASYATLAVGDRVHENAAWSYREPLGPAAWLRGYQAFYWEALDAWLDEDEQVAGHLRDPYHRVDARRSSARVRVLVDGREIAATSSPVLLSETGLPNRWYIPPQDVDGDVLRRSDTTTICPYKGTASYFGVELDGVRRDDVAWSYPEPLENALKVAGHLSFDGDDITVMVDAQ